MSKTKFSWKILGKKVLLNAIAVIIAGGISVYANNPYWLAILPVLKGIKNYSKNA